MIYERRLAVFVDQSERRTRNLLRRRGAQPLDDALGQRGLASAEITYEQDHGAGHEFSGQPLAERDRLLFRGGPVYRHTPPRRAENTSADRWPRVPARRVPSRPIAP